MLRTRCSESLLVLFLITCHADIGPLLAKCDDPKMAEDPGVSEVVKELDKACREAGFFYVVISIVYAYILFLTFLFKNM